MGGVLPGKDFASAHWETIADIADPYPDVLPSISALDFDSVKNEICAYRGYRWCSVDAVTIAADGRIWFVEFKDTSDNPVAKLRKKAFDSLLLFWIALGQDFSMEEIRRRAVFCYVEPNGKKARPSDEISAMFQKDAGETPEEPLPCQLGSVATSGLYNEVCAVDTNGFSVIVLNEHFAVDLVDLKQRITPARSFPMNAYRPPLPVDSVDFKTVVRPIVELRMVDPDLQVEYDRSTLELADRIDEGRSKVTYCHLWTCSYPVMHLATKSFDTFFMWALALHQNETLLSLGNRLLCEVVFDGVAPNLVRRSGAPKFVYDFLDIWLPAYSDRFGLRVHESEALYDLIKVSS